MKLKPAQLTPFFLAPLLLALSAALPAVAQVKIPAKSESSLEEANTPTGTNLPTTSRNQFDKKSAVNKSMPAGPTKLTPSTVTAPRPGAVTATQRVAPPKQNLDPAKIKRMAELRRELAISEAATMARLALPTEALFERTAPLTIENLSVSTLKKVVEFLELNDKQAVTVQAHFVEGEDTAKDLAWGRSLSLIEWLTSNSEILDKENFKAATPTPVLKATPRRVTKNLGENDLIGRIEITLEYKNPILE